MTGKAHRNTRHYTNKFLEALEEGLIEPDKLIKNLLCYLPEHTVAQFAEDEMYFDHEEDELDEDPLGDWYDTSAELR